MNWRDVDLAEHDLEQLLTTPQTRAVLLLHAGLSQRDAARQLGVSRSTLRSHLEAAAHRLGLTGAP